MRRRIVIFAIVWLGLLAFLGRVAMGATTQSLRATVCHRFGARCSIMLRVAWCESHLNAHAISRTGDWGLFQINYLAHHREFNFGRMLDPTYNTYAAWRLSGGGRNLSPWSSSERCWG